MPAHDDLLEGPVLGDCTLFHRWHESGLGFTHREKTYICGWYEEICETNRARSFLLPDYCLTVGTCYEVILPPFQPVRVPEGIRVQDRLYPPVHHLFDAWDGNWYVEVSSPLGYRQAQAPLQHGVDWVRKLLAEVERYTHKALEGSIESDACERRLGDIVHMMDLLCEEQKIPVKLNMMRE